MQCANSGYSEHYMIRFKKEISSVLWGNRSLFTSVCASHVTLPPEHMRITLIVHPKMNLFVIGQEIIRHIWHSFPFYKITTLKINVADCFVHTTGYSLFCAAL